MRNALRHTAFSLFSLLATLALLSTVTGCGSAPGSADAKRASSEKEDPFKDLSAADRAIAEKQKTCPITGEQLGSMGTPFKVTYKDRIAFLCCDGCKAKFDKDPEKWFKEIDDSGKK